MIMIATAVLIPAFFFFLLVRRFGTGLSTRVVTVVRVLCEASAIVLRNQEYESRDEHGRLRRSLLQRGAHWQIDFHSYFFVTSL